MYRVNIGKWSKVVDFAELCIAFDIKHSEAEFRRNYFAGRAIFPDFKGKKVTVDVDVEVPA